MPHEVEGMNASDGEVDNASEPRDRHPIGDAPKAPEPEDDEKPEGEPGGSHCTQVAVTTREGLAPWKRKD